MKNLIIFLTLQIFSIYAFANDAAIAEKPEFKVGDSFVFKDKHMTIRCKHWEIIEISGDSLIEQCDNYKMYFQVGSSYGLTKITKDDSVKFKYDPYFPTYKYPFKVGDKWSGKYSGFRSDKKAKWDSVVDFEVVAYEEVNVPAGKLKAFKIKVTDKWKAGPYSGTNKIINWYSPEVGYNIKVKHSDSPFSHELTGFNRQ